MSASPSSTRRLQATTMQCGPHSLAIPMRRNDSFMSRLRSRMIKLTLVLLEADPSLADQRCGRRNWPPLLYLCYSSYRRIESEATAARLRIARRLIELGADVQATGKELGYVSFNVNLFDQEEWFPIEAAAGQLGSPELVGLLLDAGADPKHAPIALSQAVRGGNGDVLRLLLEANHHEWQIIWALKACAVLDRK